MKGGKQELTSSESEETDLDQGIREAAASFVNDVIFRAKEMAQKSYQIQQTFSVVEEEDEEAVMAEERANRPTARLRLGSFSGPTPEIQIDLVGDRTPSPEETPTYVAPPTKNRQVKIRHRVSSGSIDESDELSNGKPPGEPNQVTDQRNQLEDDAHADRSKSNSSSTSSTNRTQSPHPDTEQSGRRKKDGDGEYRTDNAKTQQQQQMQHCTDKVTPAISSRSGVDVGAKPVRRNEDDARTEDAAAVDTATTAAAPDDVAGAARRKRAKDYLCSKPTSLPFADDTPPELAVDAAESPSEARIAERLATTKPFPAKDAKESPMQRDDPKLQHFVSEYIRNITEQAQLLADERVRRSIPHAKYHSPTDGPRASVILTAKSSDGPWYLRLRGALTRCLQSSCFCVNLGRQPEAV